jgi:hypothetical protein
MPTKGFKQYLAETEERRERIEELTLALEHLTYKNIPGTQNSYRIDPKNTNTNTERHAHVYARRNGGGKELYSVNCTGSGHDGYSGTVIPAKHADHFRGLGFEIPLNLTLESIDYSDLDPLEFELCIWGEDV